MFLLKNNAVIIKDYLLNCDSVDSDYHSLQDNESFMREVIMVTNDSEHFKKCSRRLKLNYNFVTFVIEKFLNNENFVKGVIMNFLGNTSDNNVSREFRIFLGEMYDKYHCEYLEEYKMLAYQIYVFEKNRAKERLSEVVHQCWKDELGFGFRIMADFSDGSKKVRNFLAIQTINDILKDINIEKDLHEKFNNSSAVSVYGINNYLLSIINIYDHFLTKYIELNTSLISEYVVKIKKFLERWDNYNAVFATNILLMIDKHYNENDKITISKDRVVQYVVHTLKLEKYFKYLDGFEFCSDENIEDMVNDPNLMLTDVIFLHDMEQYINQDLTDYSGSAEKRLIKVNFNSAE